MGSRGSLWLRRHPVACGVLAVAGIAVVLTLVVWVVPALLTRRPAVSGADRHKAMADARTGLIAMLGALGAAGGLAYTAKTFRLSQLAQLTGRFQDASKQMGEADPTVRLGGIQAMAQLADEWTAQRQRCVDVLCAYVRAAADRDQDSRRRVVELITDRLRGTTSADWTGCDFDFTNALFQTGDFSSVCFSTGRFSFAGACFEGQVTFDGATFTGAAVSFAGASFRHECEVSFDGARFRRGTVNFDDATFAGGEVRFRGAVFESGCRVTFARARLGNGGGVAFERATFSGPRESAGITFDDARFETDDGGDVSFADVEVGACVSFDRARFARRVRFDGASLSGGALSFRGATFVDDRLTFDHADCDGVTFFIEDAVSQGGCIDVRRAAGAPTVSPQVTSSLFCQD